MTQGDVNTDAGLRAMRTVVIGGGVVGLSIAVRLARGGHAVTVYEPDTLRQAASWGNAGHIAVEQVAPLASPGALLQAPGRLFSLGGALDLPISAAATWWPFAREFIAACRPAAHRRGRAALESLLAHAFADWRDLAQDIGAPDLLRGDGHLVVWENAASARRGRRAWSKAEIGSATFADVTADDAGRLADVTSIPAHGAVRFSGSGQIADLNLLASALEAALSTAGGRVVRSAAELKIENGRATVVGAECDQIVVAAGARSGLLMEAAGHRAPVIAERGYHLRADLAPEHADRWPANLPPVVFEDRSMIVTRFGNEIQAASFIEFNHVDAPPDPSKWARLERHVGELGLPVSPPFRRWMGARPTLPDYLPAIGRSDRVDNLIYAFGHQHLGLTLAAVTARLIGNLIEHAAPPIDLRPFSLSRFEKKAGSI